MREFDHRALSPLSPMRLADVRLALVADELAVDVVRRDGHRVRRAEPHQQHKKQRLPPSEMMTHRERS